MKNSETINHYIQVLQKPAFELQNAFIRKFKQDWGLRESVCELVIQVGHLIHAISFENSEVFDLLQQPHRKKIENIGDELSDCMLSLLSISVYANIATAEIEQLSDEGWDCSLIQKNVVLMLSVLSAQLLDSYEIYCGLKPAFQRDERHMFISFWYKIFMMVLFVADHYGVSLEKQFQEMLQDAQNFLNNSKE